MLISHHGTCLCVDVIYILDKKSYSDLDDEVIPEIKLPKTEKSKVYTIQHYINMQQYDSLITVRTSSSRLPGKCLLRFGNEETLIEFVLKRAIHYGLSPIICTSINHADDIIEEISLKYNVPCFRGSLNNKMKRWLDCAEFYNMDYFHTIDADDPFFDGERMHQSLNLLKASGCDYIKPCIYSDSGAATEGYSISVQFLKNVCSKYSSDSLDTEMAIYYFEKFEDSKFQTMSNPEYKVVISNKVPRLTLDFFEDYIFLNAISFTISQHIIRSEIEKKFDELPECIHFNINLNLIWKQNQLRKRDGF